MTTEINPKGSEAPEHEPDSKGCLLVVSSYADVADVIAPVVSDVANRVMMSHTLGDFIEVRFASLGPRAREAAERAAALAHIADDLTRPTEGAAENYFAVAIVDRSAAVVEQLQTDCEENPVLMALPLRRRGFASAEDRDRDAVPPGTEQAVDVMVPPTGVWTKHTLADAIRKYCDDLLVDFAGDHERGLGQEELRVLRSTLGEQRQPARVRGESEVDDDDELDLGSEAPLTPPEAGPSTVAAGPGQGRSAAEAAVGTPPPSTDRPARRVPVLQRLRQMPERRSRRRQLDSAAREEQAAALVYLILYRGNAVRRNALWRHASGLLVMFYRQLVTFPVNVHVRLSGDPYEIASAPLRPPGRVSRRPLRRSSGRTEFALALEQMRTTIGSDMAAIAQSRRAGVASVSVVIYAMDVPTADGVTSQEYEQLCELASVNWVVPKQSLDLMSPVFAMHNARVLADHDGVSNELRHVLETQVKLWKSLILMHLREYQMIFPGCGDSRNSILIHVLAWTGSMPVFDAGRWRSPPPSR